MVQADELPALQEQAREIRKKILEICYASKSGHIGSSFSITEILTALYFKCMRLPADGLDFARRDRLVLSKGHGCPALYAALYFKNILPEEVLKGFSANQGTLEQHPSRDHALGIDVSTGSLGHGLPLGAGMALAAKKDEADHRVFVVMSDGETNEGSTWEAALFAAQQGLDNLVAIVDYNKMQALGHTAEIINLEPFADKWRAMGWGTVEVDGHDMGRLVQVLSGLPVQPGKPNAVIAHTVKGKGVPFMENELLWHYRCPDDSEYERAVCEVC